MTGKSHFLSNLVLDQVLKNTDMGAFATIHVGLFTVAPTDAYTAAVPTGTEVPSYGTAGRKTITFGANADGPTVGRETKNSVAVSWTAWDGTSPATIVAFAILTALTAGELLYWADLTTNRTINTGEAMSFDIDALVVNED